MVKVSGQCGHMHTFCCCTISMIPCTLYHIAHEYQSIPVQNQKAIEKGLLYMLFGRLQDELEAVLEHRVMVTAFTYKKITLFH